MSSNKINKKELIEILATQLGVSKSQVEKFLATYVSVVTDAIKQDKMVTLTGFGTFYKAKRKSRKGVNPKTGDPMTIPASVSAGFTAGKTLRDNIKAA